MKNYTLSELAVILLDCYEGFEYKHKKAILDLYKGKEETLFENFEPAHSYVLTNVGDSAANTLKKSFNLDFAEDIANKLKKKNVTAITFISKEYPENFLNYPVFPLILYAKGDISLLSENKKFAIVGSRKTLPFVLRATEKISETLADNGYIIVTGSAVGGDRSAILGAVKSGKIISVLANGLDFVYPESNRALVEKIAEKGLVISEYPPETPSAPWRFPMRNRIIAALGDALLVASGSIDSGTRHTAKFAEAYSKRIYAFPYSIGESCGEICNLLIKLDKAKLIENAEDIALSEGFEIVKCSIDLTDDEKIILSAIDGQITPDKIAEKTGKKIYEVMPVLSMLEIKGAVSKAAGNMYTALIKLNSGV